MKSTQKILANVIIIMLGITGVLFVGECMTSAGIGFIDGLVRMVDTTYSAGHKLGQYLAQR